MHSTGKSIFFMPFSWQWMTTWGILDDTLSWAWKIRYTVLYDFNQGLYQALPDSGGKLPKGGISSLKPQQMVMLLKGHVQIFGIHDTKNFLASIWKKKKIGKFGFFLLREIWKMLIFNWTKFGSVLNKIIGKFGQFLREIGKFWVYIEESALSKSTLNHTVCRATDYYLDYIFCPPFPTPTPDLNGSFTPLLWFSSFFTYFTKLILCFNPSFKVLKTIFFRLYTLYIGVL